MNYEELDTVVLVRDLPKQCLRAGDLGTIVAVSEPDTFDVEFVTASGRTTALVPLTRSDLRPLSDSDILAVRSIPRSA